ncbi:MAG: SDR family oxidoreductase [Anaerolineae bacterium]|jgi:3-oxoacyl-[acyl-carrier protein] reductase|nr:SDR family oxidoreductase [Anaerolineae bacterium]
MDLGLKGAKVLVTAASQGLGAATAERFSLEGAQVVINSRNLEKLQQTAAHIVEKSGHPVYTFAGDVSEVSAAQRLVKNAAETLNGLDILIVNAGGPPAGGFDDFDATTWDQAIQLTFLSAVYLIQASLPYLRQSSRAAILTVTSIAAKQPVANLTLSNAIRPAVIGLTKTLSLELGKDQIRVNSILPGITDTERVTHLMQSRADRNHSTPEEERAKSAGEIPLGRIGTPEEFANTAVFICSPAGGFINGVALAVDGGATRATM